MSVLGRGTTPTNTFKTSIDLSEATRIYITYAQDGRPLFEKTLDDVLEITSTSVKVKLSQRDTLRLKDKFPVEVQIRAGFGGDNGDTVRSNIITTSVGRLLKDGVI